MTIRLLSINLDSRLHSKLHGRTLKNHINNILEGALRLTCEDDQSSFKKLLEKDFSVTVHQKIYKF